jgi:CheY-like chemotaxis protein
MHRFHQVLAAVLAVAVLLGTAVLYAAPVAAKTKPATAAANKAAVAKDPAPAENAAPAVNAAPAENAAPAANAAPAENAAPAANAAPAENAAPAANAAPAENAAPADNAAPAENGAATAPAENAAENAAASEPAAAVEPAKGSLEDLWKNLVYYIKIARPDMAKSYALGIIESLKGGEKPDNLYMLTTNTFGWQGLIARGAKLEGLAAPLADVRKAIEEGYNIRRSDPSEIKKAIDMLETGMTAYELGVSRLKESGEYALPQLIQRLTDPKSTTVLRERIVDVLPRIGMQAARPLCVAMLSDSDELQVICANSLSQIGYPLALPHLKELYDRQGALPKVKEAARRAIVTIGGDSAFKKPSAELFYELAESYYKSAESLTPDVRSPTANVWYWKEGLGLTYKAVPREIFTDVYAMRNAALTLKQDANYYPAVSLWLAANFKREADLPKGAKDPTLGDNEMPAEFYALASSAKYLQDVLARAMADQNSAVAIGAIGALDKTAGAKNLVAPVAGGVSPLVKALTYPDRQVRYMAALALAKALPTENFAGSDLVEIVLNEMVRQTGTKRALLVVGDDKVRNIMKDALRSAGYEVVDEPDPSKAKEAARAVAGVDLVVMAEKPSASEFIRVLRRDPMFMAIPAAVLNTTVEFSRFAEKDKRTVVIEKPEAPLVTAAADKALQLGAGSPLSPEEASNWAVKAANAVRTLGLTNNPVLDVKYTRASLIGALADKRGEVQTAAAGALAMMNVPEAQRAICNLAVKGQASEKVRVAVFNSLSESVKKFGNFLTDEQAQAVLEVVNTKGSIELRNAAAGALGALNLPSEKIKTLIPVPAGT